MHDVAHCKQRFQHEGECAAQAQARKSIVRRLINYSLNERTQVCTRVYGNFRQSDWLKSHETVTQPLEVLQQRNFITLFTARLSIDSKILSKKGLKFKKLCSIKIMDIYECRHYTCTLPYLLK